MTPCSTASQTAAFLAAVAEPTRLRVICTLKEGELCACELAERLGVPQNLLSHHLKSLRGFGLLRSRREGQKIFYALEREALAAHLAATNALFATNPA